MTIEECYGRMGADYPDVLRRMGKADRVERFLRKLPQDGSFSLLCSSVSDGNIEEAFRAAHSLKGICANLGLSRLYDSSSALCDALRGGIWQESCSAMLETVKFQYEDAMASIRLLDEN